jgi:hypothetical protein
MEDGYWLDQEDKNKMSSLKKELLELNPETPIRFDVPVWEEWPL